MVIAGFIGSTLLFVVVALVLFGVLLGWFFRR